MILDTCFIIDLLEGNEEAYEKLLELDTNDVTQIITTVSVFELIVGVERSNNVEKEKNRTTKIYEKMLIANLDHKSAVCAGEIFAQQMSKGRTLPFSDCLIAGIAISNNETLLTRNVKDFSRIERLKIESY